MKATIFATPLFAATVGWFGFFAQPIPDADSQIELKRRATHDALAAAVKLHEESLARELKLQKRGASSEMEVNARRQVLAMLRHDAAVNNEDPDEAIEQTRTMVKLREATLERLMKLRASGAVAADVIDTARRQVANMKYILATEQEEPEDAIGHLRTIVEICMAELKRVEGAAKSGSASPAEVSLIRGRLAYANYLLCRENEEPGKAVAQLRIVIAERESAANRMEKLFRAGAAGHIIFVEAQYNALWAKANLTIEENQRDLTRDSLKKLVEFTKENLAYWKSQPDPATPELIARIQAALADCELRLTLAADPDTPLRTLLRKPMRELDY